MSVTRVIHHDGRTGTRRDPNGRAPCVGVEWDDGSWSVPIDGVRPLGEVEEKLLEADPEKPWAGLSIGKSRAFDLYTRSIEMMLPYKRDYATTVRAEALSEALQYCREMWRQHGVVV